VRKHFPAYGVLSGGAGNEPPHPCSMV
jgi:hypothetical protein